MPPAPARRAEAAHGTGELSEELERTIEALLFLSADPVEPAALAEATGAELHEVVTALERLREYYEFERRGIVLRELAGGLSLSCVPRPRRRRGGCSRGRARRR